MEGIDCYIPKMNRVPNDVKEYMTTYVSGTDIGKVAKGTKIDVSYLINRIREYNPSFSILDVLSTELEYEREMDKIRKRPAYEFYKIIYPDVGLASEAFLEGSTGSLYIETLADISPLFGKDLIRKGNKIDAYNVKVGPNHIIKDGEQFIRDLHIIRKYMNRYNPLYVSSSDEGSIALL